MSTPVNKKWFIAGGAAVLGLIAYSHLKGAVSNLSFRLAGIGKPQIKAGELQIPIKLAFTNPSDIPFPISNVAAFAQIQKGDLWLEVAHTQPSGPFTIIPGQSGQVFNAIVNFRTFGNNIFDALSNLLKTRSIKVQASVNIKGAVITEEKLFNVPL